MWLRNSNISERIQENELFTSYVPGLQDVGSYGNRASVHFFFLHGLGYKFLQQHYRSYNPTGKRVKIQASETPIKLCRWKQAAESDPRRAGKVLVSRAGPWLLAVSPPSHTQQPNLILDEEKLIYKAESTSSIFPHSFCSPLQVSKAGYSSLLVLHAEWHIL